jgi:chemotaxis protein MotB
MQSRTITAHILLSALALFILAGCVSKDEYLVKVQESEDLSSELLAARSQNARLERENEQLEGDKKELKLEALSLEEEITRLKEDSTNLVEVSEARSNTLMKQVEELEQGIAELEKEHSRLLEENESLQAEALDLEVDKKEEVLTMTNTYNDLLEDMKSEIERGNVTITQLKGKLKVNMVDEILFDSGKTTVKAEGVKILKRVGSILLNVKDRTISIEGHTDNVPIGPGLAQRYPTNWELSVARATNVARYLQDNVGVDPSLLSATGYGEYRPIASNKTVQGRAKNRRIEIVIVPKRGESE